MIEAPFRAGPSGRLARPRADAIFFAAGRSAPATGAEGTMGIVTAATWAGYSVALAPLMRRYSPFRLSAIFLLGAAVLLVAVGAPQLREESFDLPASVWLTFAYAVIGPLVITNLLWFTAIDWVGPSRASLFANLQPFLAAVIALLLLHESLTRLQLAGGLLIAAGIVFSRRPEPAGARAS